MSSWYARRACQYMLLTAVPVIARLPSTNYVRHEWCTALANAQPPVQPKWGGEELQRRRRCCEGGNATDGGLDEIVKAAATSAAGQPIFPSEGGQDRFLWLAHFQYLKRPIVYADFGSNNAVFTSNTFFLDQCLGASGVCVGLCGGLLGEVDLSDDLDDATTAHMSTFDFDCSF